MARKKGSTAIKLHLLPEAVETFYVHTKSRLYVKHAERVETFKLSLGFFYSILLHKAEKIIDYPLNLKSIKTAYSMNIFSLSITNETFP